MSSRVITGTGSVSELCSWSEPRRKLGCSRSVPFTGSVRMVKNRKNGIKVTWKKYKTIQIYVFINGTQS